jgi:hypothetical protein
VWRSWKKRANQVQQDHALRYVLGDPGYTSNTTLKVLPMVQFGEPCGTCRLLSSMPGALFSVDDDFPGLGKAGRVHADEVDTRGDPLACAP